MDRRQGMVRCGDAEAGRRVRMTGAANRNGMAARKAALRDELESVRARTLELLERVPDDFLKVRVHDFYSPIGWHFGHIGMTEEHWVICRALGGRPNDERLSFLYANLPDNPKDNRVHLPSRDEIRSYLAATRSAVLDALESTDIAHANPLIADGYAWDFALQHECQHQETIAEMLQLIHQQIDRLGGGRVTDDGRQNSELGIRNSEEPER